MKQRQAIIRFFCILGLLQILVIGVQAIPISFGETVTGNISAPSQMNDYTFNANASDTIYTRMRASWSNGPLIVLQYPNGTRVSAPSGGYDTDLIHILPSTGQYTLLVGDRYGGSTGTYGLYLQRTNNPGRAEPMAFGETKTGSITKPAQLNNFTFTATKGDTIYTRMRSNWSNGPLLLLYAPNGTLISSAPSGGYDTQLTQILPMNGTYTLLAGDRYGGSTGTYGLYLQRTNNPGRAEPMAFGETKTGSITKPAQLNNFTFTATKGDTIYTRMRASWSNGPLLLLWAPNGTLISSAPSGGYDTQLTQILPMNGTYTLLVGDRYGGSTGTYGLYLQRTNNPGNAEEIVSGETKTGSITKPAQLNTYIFTTPKDATLLTRMNSNWSNGPLLLLWAPNGTLISNAPSGGYDTEINIQNLDVAGKYTLLAGDRYGGSTGTYGLYMKLSGIPPFVTVTSPNGGESWVNGTSHAITWTSFEDVGSYVKIEVLKAGVVVQNLSSSTPNNGSFSWTIGLAPGTDYKIRITSTTNTGITDTSDGNFTIIGGNPGSITVTSPNGGEIWNQNTTHPITWSYTGSPGSSVKIELLKNGIFYQLLKSNTSMGSAGSGSFPWTISPNTKPGADYKVRVQSLSQPTVNDLSNNTFTINSTTQLSRPSASFITNVTSGTTPFAVQFTDTSLGSPTMWNWSFGDGTWFNTTLASQKNPVHVYVTKGTFPARLTVCNAIGCDTTTPGILAR